MANGHRIGCNGPLVTFVNLVSDPCDAEMLGALAEVAGGGEFEAEIVPVQLAGKPQAWQGAFAQDGCSAADLEMAVRRVGVGQVVGWAASEER